MNLTADLVSAVLGGALSFALDLVPVLRERWAEFDGGQKRSLLAVASVVMAFALVAAHYAGLVDLGLPAQFGAEVIGHAITIALSAVGGAQVAYTGQRVGRA